MKSVLFLMLATFAFIFVNAQQFKGKIEGVKIYKDSLLVFNDNVFPNAKFLYDTEKGKVFQLPLDHMRCFVPTFKSNMPVYNLNPHNQNIVHVPIPNPFIKINPVIIQNVKRIPVPH